MGLNTSVPASVDPYASVYNASPSQTAGFHTETKILFPDERSDTNGNFSGSRFTATVAGKYYLGLTLQLTKANDWALGDYIDVIFRKNGGTDVKFTANMSAGDGVSTMIHFTDTVPLVATDFVEVYIYNENAEGHDLGIYTETRWVIGKLST